MGTGWWEQALALPLTLMSSTMMGRSGIVNPNSVWYLKMERIPQHTYKVTGNFSFSAQPGGEGLLEIAVTTRPLPFLSCDHERTVRSVVAEVEKGCGGDVVTGESLGLQLTDTLFRQGVNALIKVWERVRYVEKSPNEQDIVLPMGGERDWITLIDLGTRFLHFFDNVSQGQTVRGQYARVPAKTGKGRQDSNMKPTSRIFCA